jgi:hypothetical protein
MKPSVYVETSIISYFSSRPSNDILVLAKQRLTQQWWEKVLPSCAPHISQIVLNEISRGDSQASKKRVRLVSEFPSLGVDQEIIKLAERISKFLLLPEKALADAYHISIPTVHEIDYLVTWNCTHIANAFQSRNLEAFIVASGYRVPCICTPEEMMEVPHE